MSNKDLKVYPLLRTPNGALCFQKTGGDFYERNTPHRVLGASKDRYSCYTYYTTILRNGATREDMPTLQCYKHRVPCINFYVDFNNGNDDKDGSSWEFALKTLHRAWEIFGFESRQGFASQRDVGMKINCRGTLRDWYDIGGFKTPSDWTTFDDSGVGGQYPIVLIDNLVAVCEINAIAYNKYYNTGSLPNYPYLTNANIQLNDHADHSGGAPLRTSGMENCTVTLRYTKNHIEYEIPIFRCSTMINSSVILYNYNLYETCCINSKITMLEGYTYRMSGTNTTFCLTSTDDQSPIGVNFYSLQDCSCVFIHNIQRDTPDIWVNCGFNLEITYANNCDIRATTTYSIKKPLDSYIDYYVRVALHAKGTRWEQVQCAFAMPDLPNAPKATTTDNGDGNWGASVDFNLYKYIGISNLINCVFNIGLNVPLPGDGGDAIDMQHYAGYGGGSSVSGAGTNGFGYHRYQTTSPCSFKIDDTVYVVPGAKNCSGEIVDFGSWFASDVKLTNVTVNVDIKSGYNSNPEQ